MTAVAAIVVLAGCGGNPVATVDGVEITQAEFNERLVQQYGEDMLREMIDRELLRQAAEDAGIEITEEELQQEIEDFKSQFGNEENFNQWLASRNLSEEEFQDQMRMALVSRKLALKDVQPSDEELQQYFEENKEAFAQPAMVSLSEIVVDSREAAEEVLSKLEQGDFSFEDLAAQYSLSIASKNRGGELPPMPLRDVPQELREVAQSLPVGEVSDPIPANNAWYIIKVRDRQPAREASWPEDKERVLQRYQAEHARDLQQVLREQLQKTNVQIIDPRFEALNEVYTAIPTEVPEFGAQGPQGAAPDAEENASEAPEEQQPAGDSQ